MTEPKVRYSDEDLQEFKTIVDKRIEKAQEELNYTQQQIAELNENGFNQQGGDWYDDSTAHTDLELLQRMAQRQQRHLQDLQNALLRIHNKTYGVCTITGHLISKERLRLVPHATKSVDGKNIANATQSTGGEGEAGHSGHDEANRPPARPIADKVRHPAVRRSSSNNEDWEVDNESMENATGYSSNRKFEDDEE